MTIKETFKKLEQVNEFNHEFNLPSLCYVVYFNDYDRKYVSTYRDFMRYIRKEYNKEFIETALSKDFQRCADNSLYMSFIACGVGCSIEIRIA